MEATAEPLEENVREADDAADGTTDAETLDDGVAVCDADELVEGDTVAGTLLEGDTLGVSEEVGVTDDDTGTG